MENSVKIFGPDRPCSDIEGYWVSPAGEIHLLETKHIDMVFDMPELFGLDIEYIKSVFNRYDEEYRTEANARREILIMLFEKGWIRARRYRRPAGWTVNVYSLNSETRTILALFGSAMIKRGHSPYDDIKLDTHQGQERVALKEISEGLQDVINN
ncbi:MAG TPA: hypothetical protein PK986_08435 [Spirochaetota bacterium]|nr:hypothetical protein [Spirochaetota bacterium]